MRRLSLRFFVVSSLALVATSLTTPPSHARIWSDPDWPTMIAQSDLIVLVEVAEGGKFTAKVKAVKAFKGTAPKAPFWIDGFNDPQTNEKSIELGRFKNGEKYYLFLHRTKLTPPWIDHLAKDKDYHADYVTALRDLKTNEVYSAWTPSAGAISRVDDEVPFTLHWTTYSRFRGTKRPAADFETILQKSLGYLVDKKRDVAYLDGVVKSLVNEHGGQKKVDLGHLLLSLHLGGENRYHDVFEKLATHESAGARVPLARLLGQVDDPKAQKVLLTLLKDKNPIIQGEAVRQLAKGDPKVVGPALVDALPTAKPGGLGPNELMDPVRNEMAGGFVEIVKALGTMKYKPATKALLPLLEHRDPQVLGLTTWALREMENRDYVPVLAGRIKNADRDTMQVVLQLAREFKLKELTPPLVAWLDKPSDNTYLRSDVVKTLGEIGDETAAKALLADLERHLAKKNLHWQEAGVVTELVSALGELKHAPAKATVYRSVYAWFGVDDDFAAKPELMTVKEKLEKEMVERALKAAADLTNVKASAFVLLENRKAMAADPAVKPVYRALVRVETTDGFGFNGETTKIRGRIAKALDVPVDDVQLDSHVTNRGRTVDGSEARHDEHRAQFLMWRVLHFLSHDHDMNDDRFLKWSVVNGRIEPGLASEIIPTLFPPTKKSER